MTIATERPTAGAHAEEPIQVLIEEALQHRRRRVGVWLAALLLVGALVAVLAMGGGSGGPKLAHNSLDNANASPLAVGALPTVRSELLAYLFPTSGADFANGLRYTALISGLTVQLKAACLTDAGYPSTVRTTRWGNVGGDNSEFPDIAQLSSRGFLLTGSASHLTTYNVASVGSAPTGAASAAYWSARSRCGAAARAHFSPIARAYAPLAAAWSGHTVPSIDRSATFQKALVGWASCLQRRGVRVSTLSDFFQFADAASHKSPASRYVVNLGKWYATCLAPAEAARDHLRLTARDAFLATHSDQIAVVSQRLAQIMG
jgi:hypothetical protein